MTLDDIIIVIIAGIALFLLGFFLCFGIAFVLAKCDSIRCFYAGNDKFTSGIDS